MKKLIIFFMSAVLSICSVSTMKKYNQISYAKNISQKEETKLLEIKAKSAILVDYDSGTIIYEKKPNERLPIASMTKLASLAVVFNSIDKGIIKESDMVSVSTNAGNVQGSSAFLDAGSKYKLTDLIKTVVIASANDSTVALAEFVAGSENVFVSKMNKFIKELGLKDTNFENCTGLPQANHYSTASDMIVIYKHICNNRIYKKYSKIWMDDFIHPSGRKTTLVNTNRLVKTYDGVEGGKTGYTDSAKFCLTASAKRGNTRLVGVVIGENDSKTRFKDMTNLFNYGFSNFETKMLINKDIPIDFVTIKGAKEKFEIYSKEDVMIFNEKINEKKYTTDFKINEKLKAPQKSGSVIGKLFVFDENNMVIKEIDLIVKKDIKAETIKDEIIKLIFAW